MHRVKTRVTELLGTRYPIIQGGMQWVGRAPLAAAVSNAGGLGILTAMTQPHPEALRAEILQCRALTDKPFGVNLSIGSAPKRHPYEAYLSVAFDCGITIIETAGARPDALLPMMKEKGAIVIHKCTSVRHALSAERAGVDVISIDGFECAGHPGEDGVGGLVLIPAAANKVHIPIVATGGIADGRGLAAALVLGAEGVTMGTRFCVTQEAPIHENIKRALMSADERSTTLIMRSLRNTARVLSNQVARAVLDIEGRGQQTVFDDIRELVAGEQGALALAEGDVNRGLVWAGQSVGLIDDLPTCENLIRDMVQTCARQLGCAIAMM